MLNSIFQLAYRDFWRLIRHPVVLLWAFVMPVIFFSFIGKVTGRAGPDPERPDAIGVFVPEGAGFLADALVRQLAAARYEIHRVPSAEALAKYDRRLTIPAGLTANVLAGKPQKVVFERSGDPGMGGDYDKIRLSKATYGVLAEVIASGKRTGAVTAASLESISKEPRSLKIETTSAGKRPNPPSGYQQSVPGTLVMFVLMVMLTSGGISIVKERRQGILRRLASCPMSRGSVVAAKWLARIGLAVIQTCVGAAIGTILFHVEWGGAILAIAALMAAYIALCGSLGLLLGSLARTEGQASAIGVIAGNLLAAFGGCWWPMEISPEWMRKFALVLPTGQTMDGLHRLMSFGQDGTAVLPHIAVLLAMSLVAGWLAARAFRFQ